MLADLETNEMTKLLIGVVTALTALFGWLTSNQRTRIRELEREQGVAKKTETALEKRVERCEADRMNLREHIIAGDKSRMDLSIQLNTALLALNAATERARANEPMNPRKGT